MGRVLHLLLWNMIWVKGVKGILGKRREYLEKKKWRGEGGEKNLGVGGPNSKTYHVPIEAPNE